MLDNCTIPFLDTLVKVRKDNTQSVNVCRKPTRTDQYLQFDSAHPLEHKLSVIHTLYHRVDTVVLEWNEIQKEHVAKLWVSVGTPSGP